jgi:hypothetical protein
MRGIMPILKKCEQVEIFLRNLLQQDGFGLKELEALNYKKIVNARELEGIGERTISNVLLAFKEKQGIEIPEKRATKKRQVEDYLTDLLESGKISRRNLLRLRYNDLRDTEELANVGKTTIACTLVQFKRKNETKSFELGVLDFLAQEKSSSSQEPAEVEKVAEVVPVMETQPVVETGSVIETQPVMETGSVIETQPVMETGFVIETQPAVEARPVTETQPAVEARSVRETRPVMETRSLTPPVKTELDQDHVVTLKQMISEFQAQKISEEEMRAYELRELKYALHFVGISPSKIVRLYWEDISRDFMNRKILSGKAAVSSQLQLSSLMQ